MTDRTQFSDEEWLLLLDIPPLVGSAVMVAGKSGLGTIKEAYALANSVLAGKQGYPGNPLIKALIDARTEEGERSQVETIAGNPYRGLGPDELLEVVLAKCEDVQSLLAAKIDAREAAEFYRWALDVGQHVAEAAKEGGFLGIGGERVSAEERDVLQRVRQAFGLAATE